MFTMKYNLVIHTTVSNPSCVMQGLFFALKKKVEPKGSHMNGFALRLLLTQRQKATWKWGIGLM